jgi:hypothetical protein
MFEPLFDLGTLFPYIKVLSHRILLGKVFDEAAKLLRLGFWSNPSKVLLYHSYFIFI